ncbi:hypothetical protein Tco_0524246 [Tanacetum coccineum]
MIGGCPTMIGTCYGIVNRKPYRGLLKWSSELMDKKTQHYRLKDMQKIAKFDELPRQQNLPQHNKRKPKKKWDRTRPTASSVGVQGYT